MKLLLHTCCAPCLIYPLRQLEKRGYRVSGLFYNPNIHPQAEYDQRRQAVAEFSEVAKIEVIYPQYNPKEYLQALDTIETRPERCPICWYLRLKRTAQEAKEKGFETFSTTLLVSPYQDQEALKEIGNDIAKEIGIKFYYEDFRPGFRHAHNEAKTRGIYCQRYCGCIYSEVERCKKSGKR